MLAEGLGVTRDEPIDFRFWAWTAPWTSLTAITTKSEPDRSDETSTYRPRFAKRLIAPHGQAETLRSASCPQLAQRALLATTRLPLVAIGTALTQIP